MAEDFYTSHAWRSLRELVLERDGSVCIVGRLLRGDCAGDLHVHHVEPRDERPDLELDPDNCVTVCARHHPTWEALRRLLRILGGETALPPCRHRHPYKSGREDCDRRRRRELAERRAARLARAVA